MRHSTKSLVFAFLAYLFTPTAVIAEELVIPSLTYRTGPYASSGIPYSDGFSDYLTLLNERDGGINGNPIKVIECEFGYNTEKGVACFEETLAQGALVYHPMSTGLTYQIMKRAHEEGVVVHTMGYGLTAVADGGMFPYGFNFPAHYWHAASAQIRHIKDVEGGSLVGKKIMHMFHNSGYGKEPIPTLETLADLEGFELVLQPIDHPGEEQGAVWQQVREVQPDYILLWGWGIMNSVALGNAVDIDFPLDRIVGVWWSANEGDIKPLGRAGNGYKAVTFHAVGTSFKIFNEMNELVYQAGKARGDLRNLGEVLYNRGVMAAIFAAEAIRLGMEIEDTNDVTREVVRVGFENLRMDEESFETIGMEGFLPLVEVTCENHAAAGLVAVKQWNSAARRWVQISDYYTPDTELIDPQVAEASEAFADGAEMTRKGC